MTDRGFQQANDQSRERLARLVATLTPTQLTVDLGEGWTVASALAHMGFWDRWQEVRWTEMLAGRWSADDDSMIDAEHVANEALHPYWSGIDAEDIPTLALDAATKLDAVIASAPDAILDSLEGGPSAFLIHRHRHRDQHIDHIERSLAAADAARAAAKPLDRSIIDRNAESRRRMAALVGRLTAADYALPTAPTEEGSWTVGQTLGHLAFWDRSIAARWTDAVERAGSDGPLEPIGVPGDVLVAINPPLAALIGAWTASLGTAIGNEAVSAAESIDALLESLAGRIPGSLADERPAWVNRWMHREEHLGSVEAALRR